MVHEDNAAMIQVMNSGKNPTMRGLGITHGTSINRLHEAFQDDWNELVKEGTDTMAGDIFTKGFENKEKWIRACAMINIFDPENLDYAPRDAGGKPGGHQGSSPRATKSKCLTTVKKVQKLLKTN